MADSFWSYIPGTTDWGLRALNNLGVNVPRSTNAEQIGGAVNNGTGNIFPELGENIGDQFGGLPSDYSLGQSTYDFTQRVFPSDLGSNASFNGHYMVININVQNNSAMSKISRTGSSGVSGTETIFNRLDEISKTDVLRYKIDGQLTNDSNLPLNQGGLSSRTRFTRRIKESIALYMPNSELSFTDAHDYENISLTRFITGGIAGASGALLTGAAAATMSPVGAAAAISTAGGIGNAIGGAIGGAAQVLGAPINPKVEILYANTFQRQFAFDFLLAPSTPEESMTIKQIIRTLRFHAAPELRPSEIGSFFWIPPSEFDITFYNRGVENTAIPRVNTCVLNQIDVSYAPTGAYATFSNGHPVQIRLMLRFTETEVAHKLRVLQGF